MRLLHPTPHTQAHNPQLTGEITIHCLHHGQAQSRDTGGDKDEQVTWLQALQRVRVAEATDACGGALQLRQKCWGLRFTVRGEWGEPCSSTGSGCMSLGRILPFLGNSLMSVT